MSKETFKTNSVEITIDKGNIDSAFFNRYTDLIVFGVASRTLDLTSQESRFPRKTGNLAHKSMVQRTRKEADCVYCLDNPEGAEYAKYVWNMENVNWTNPNTYPQWFATVYQNNKELITEYAVSQAINIANMAEKEVK